MECMADGSMTGMMWWMLVWGLVGLASLVALVLGSVWLVRRGLGSAPREESADEILRRRFAEGEIDEDEYYRLRAKLRE